MDRSKEMGGEPGGRRGSAGDEPGASEPGASESLESRETESGEPEPGEALEGESEDSPREGQSGMREIMRRVNKALRKRSGASPDR